MLSLISSIIFNSSALESSIAKQSFIDRSHQDIQIATLVNKSMCQNTLAMVKSQLGVVKSVKIERIGAVYLDRPRNRSMSANFTLDNSSRSEKLINSPTKLLTASQRIVKNCPNVGMASFYLDQTDNGVVYGTVGGKMKQFVCNNETSIKWGEVVCP